MSSPGTISVLDLFTIGIGPSSSHTVGPMRAAGRFASSLAETGLLERTAKIEVHLYGSLALTGVGHGTDRAVLLGLEGELPDAVDPGSIANRVDGIRKTKKLRIGGWHEITFDEVCDLRWHRGESLPRHSNGLRFIARDVSGNELLDATFYSIGGGFVIAENAVSTTLDRPPQHDLPFPYRSGADILRMAHESGLSVGEMVLRNECCFRSESEIQRALQRVWDTMQQCVERGCHAEGTLPGGLSVARRAPKLHRELTASPKMDLGDPLAVLDWLSLWAIAVSEENASGGRVVTAPTNGAAGIIPAVLHYLVRFHGAKPDTIQRFLLTAGGIGLLYKMNASISGAEVGCQGEVGVACSMAAAALAEAMGGSVPQVENAAEIAMEHNLGLTCDPVGGLVQVPCIERNALGAAKALQAGRLALAGDGTHRVSLDTVIAAMRQTGADMSTKYKETSQAGLAAGRIRPCGSGITI